MIKVIFDFIGLPFSFSQKQEKNFQIWKLQWMILIILINWNTSQANFIVWLKK